MRSALAFLTTLGGAAVPDRRTVTWFPLIGAALGLVLGGIWWGANELWSPLLAAALVVVADLALTGMLHLDGLADSADGLLPHTDRARRLAIMAEPTIGAFGVGAVASVLLVRLSALASIEPHALLLAGTWCGARTVMAVAIRRVPYARTEGGLATAMQGGDWRSIGLVGLIATVSLGALASGRQTELAVAVGMLAGLLVVAAARRRIGGFTGDVLGAAGLVAETVALVVAAASW